MAELAQVSGFWALPVLESTGDPVTMHVSIAVGSEEDLASSDVDATLSAGGQVLAQSYGPSDRALSFVSTGSTTAIADFGWSNPDQLTPDSVEVRIRDESVVFPLGIPGDFPVA